nr:MAG TPA: hypothetical protein [Caudoviricetes sp.]
MSLAIICLYYFFIIKSNLPSVSFNIFCNF